MAVRQRALYVCTHCGWAGREPHVTPDASRLTYCPRCPYQVRALFEEKPRIPPGEDP